MAITLADVDHALRKMVFEGDSTLFHEMVIPAIERGELLVNATPEGLDLRLASADEHAEPKS